jgi:hypothetical protein
MSSRTPLRPRRCLADFRISDTRALSIVFALVRRLSFTQPRTPHHDDDAADAPLETAHEDDEVWHSSSALHFANSTILVSLGVQ